MRTPFYHCNLSTPPTLALAAISASFLLRTIDAGVACTEDRECQAILRPGSECIQGECTNPFRKGGCLKQMLPGWNKIRVCNSEDTAEDLEKGYCRKPNEGLEYPEIRIFGQNWESAFFQAWLLQILLTEVLDVPATIETGAAGKTLNFYDPTNELDYVTGYDFEALARGNELGDCTGLNQNDSKEYQSCAHMIPEVWEGQKKTVAALRSEDTIEARNVGLLGQQGLFVPRFTAMKDPTLLTSFGLVANRTKLAETFKRPTSWKDYCEQISPNNCATPDTVAIRAPLTETEEQRMFEEDLYTGHFRTTDDHDCEKHPDTCTGDFVDYPCGWTSYNFQQFYHLGIALKSNGPEEVTGGYTYNQMTEIWAAANATKSDVMMRWWTPEALYQTFLNSDAEFQRVSLPPPTQDCVEGRVPVDTRCTGNLTERIGDPVGICDDPSHSLTRLVVKSLGDSYLDSTKPAETRSPGYDMVTSLTLSELQIGKIFDYWLKRGSDKWNFDPRDAACRWLAENQETIRPMIPKTYPRVVQENEDYYKEALFYVSLAFAAGATGLVLVVMIAIYRNRLKPAVALAQIEFLWMLLGGLLMVALASGVLVVPATDGSCTSVIWLADLGFTLGLVPLIVKMAAINKLMIAAKSMRRVVINRKGLFGYVFGLCFLMVLYLLAWTIVDPPRRTADYVISDNVSANGETIVVVSYHCASDSDLWRMLTAGWDAILLFVAALYTFQTRKIRSEINESQPLAVLIYSHCVFVAQRCILFAFEDSLTTWNVNRYLSLIYSVGTIAACCIYFIPKLLKKESRPPDFSQPNPDRPVRWSQMSTAGSRRHSRITGKGGPSSYTVGGDGSAAGGGVSSHAQHDIDSLSSYTNHSHESPVAAQDEGMLEDSKDAHKEDDVPRSSAEEVTRPATLAPASTRLRDTNQASSSGIDFET